MKEPAQGTSSGQDWFTCLPETGGRQTEEELLKFPARLFFARLSRHSKVVQLTAEGSSGSLTPQTLCSPELKTESHQVNFKLVLWMRQGSVIVSGGQRRHKGGNGGDQENSE